MADAYVADTGVFVRWYIPQVGFEHARQVRDDLAAGAVEITTSDAARYELSNSLRRDGYVKGRLTREELILGAGVLDDLQLLRRTDTPGVRRATALAADRGITVFDALFVDLALETGWPLLTSDARLARSGIGNIVQIELLQGIPE